MENNTSIDDILNDEPATRIEEQPHDDGPPRDESGRFAPKDTGENQPEAEVQPEPVTPPVQEVDTGHIPIAALKDERAKRQQLEQQLQQYEAYYQQQLAAQQQQPQYAPDMYADPEGYAAYLRDSLRQELMAETQQTIQHQAVVQKAEFSEIMARQKFADYDEKVEVFKQMVEENPHLLNVLQRAPDPAAYAYQAAQQHLEALRYAEPMPTREQMEAKIRAEIMAGIGVQRPTAPNTLANERSVGARSGPTWSGPTAIGDILSR